MRRLALLPVFALAACGATPGPASAPVAAAVTQPIADQAAPPAFEASVASLRARKSTTVRSLPDERSAPLGVLAQDMRVGWRGAESGPGCARWIEIEPRGFVCELALEPSRLPPFAFELPRLGRGAILPGIYGAPAGRGGKHARLLATIGGYRQFRSLSAMLKFRDEVKVRGRSYLRTRLGQLIDARAVRLREPSAFSGIEIGGAGAPMLPLAWALSRSAAKSPIAVWSDPADGELLGVLPPRAAVPIL
ncbi:MAG: ErfK/YbiS/YcfS/YnhG family protein, partial [Myxococcaceae bacterium]|nr:ErfK/YbiS/YcfS/YnhG family protein [Myxococcaceae bacterium]